MVPYKLANMEGEAKNTMKYNEVSHFSPHHKPKFERSKFPFTCDGCKEAGMGSRYKCSACDFDLHPQCAVPSPSLLHPFYTKCSFQFFARPPGGEPRYCNACSRNVLGYVYHCKNCGFDLHPCCANLPMMQDIGEAKLCLCSKLREPCMRCGRKEKSWGYKSKCKEYNLHVACVKDLLMEKWQELDFGQESSRLSLSRTTAPSFNRHRSTSKVKKWYETAALALQFVVSAVLGDPTMIIAGVVGSLISAS